MKAKFNLFSSLGVIGGMLVVLVAFLCAIPMDVKSAEKQPLGIGFLYPLTGGASEYGKRFIQSAVMAAEDINAKGGINGIPIEWVIEDTAGDKAQAVTMYKKMAANPRIMAINGPQRTDTSLVVDPLTATYGLASLCLAVTEFPKPLSPFMFHPLSPATWGFKYALAELKKKKGAQTVVIVNSYDSDYPVAMAKGIKAMIPELGLKLVGEATWRTGDVDFSAQLTKIKVLSPDIICSFGHEGELAPFMKQARERGISSQFVMTGITVKLVELSKGAAKGAIEPMMWDPNSARPEVQDFIKRFQNKLGRFPDNYEAAAYDNTLLIANAAQRAGTPWNRVAIRDALEKTTKFTGMCGNYTFNERRYNAEPTFYLYQAVEGKLIPWP
jgi:branched-chain amino acid transport system substrate-binding protein